MTISIDHITAAVPQTTALSRPFYQYQTPGAKAVAPFITAGSSMSASNH